jgi:hypothetical protein
MKPKKPTKPYRDFLLFLHQTGQWAKKVRGRTHYFGVDADGALAKWLKDKDHLLAGRTPPLHQHGITIRDLCNRVLGSRKLLVDSGELSPRSWRHYYATCENLIAHLGKPLPVSDLTPPDLEQRRAKLAKTRGPHALAGEV